MQNFMPIKNDKNENFPKMYRYWDIWKRKKIVNIFFLKYLKNGSF